MRRSRILSCVAALAVLTACNDDLDAGSSAADATEAMVLETCAPTGDPLEVEVCRCAFDAVTQDYDGDDLERLDRRLRDEPDQIPPEVQEAILDCTFAVLEPPRQTTSTSIPSQDEG